jgi:hypothetical protein
MQLPRIAKFFGVTIDYLFYSEGISQPYQHDKIPDDDILRIIQFRGNKMLDADLWEKDKYITLKIPDEISNEISKIEFKTEIWGNANIAGNIGGYVECGGGVNSGNIGGYVECGGGVNGGNIDGYVECGGGVNCGNISGYVECGGGINCGDINDYAECGGGLKCNTIAGAVECGGDLTCDNIGGKVECEGNIRCREIKGDVKCEGDIIYENKL